MHTSIVSGKSVLRNHQHLFDELPPFFRVNGGLAELDEANLGTVSRLFEIIVVSASELRLKSHRSYMTRHLR